MKSGKYIQNIIRASLLTIVIFPSCKKDWLDEKPQLSYKIPFTIADYQALLDNTVNGNAVSLNESHSVLGEVGSGDFYVTDAVLATRPAIEQGTYKWLADIYGGEKNYGEWTKPYENIFYSNVVLEGIETIIPADNNQQTAWNNVKGSALFFRGYNHYNIAEHYCKAYNSTTANTDLGIPLRLASDFNEVSKRSTVLETYDQILADLKRSVPLLPVSIPANNYDAISRCRPNKAAANAMLARVYLAMSLYDSAFAYADRALQLYNILLDYNTIPQATLNSQTAAAFQRFHQEVLFHNVGNLWSVLLSSRLIVDSTLYRLFDTTDLRRKAYFRLLNNNITVKTGYSAANGFFTGLATDEIYLIRAECYARKGLVTEALADLNKLYRNRWDNSKGPFQPIAAITANDALKKILTERRKELSFRGLRWADLRRLNMESQFAVTLKRVVGGVEYSLPPNDPKYILPIPLIVIELTGMQQNPRQ